MKYKVGDKVKVRSDLRVGKSYGEHTFVHAMFKFMGKIVTIESVWEQCYRIEEDAYWWTDEMLEPVEEMSAEEALKHGSRWGKWIYLILLEVCSSERLNSGLFRRWWRGIRRNRDGTRQTSRHSN